MKPALGDVVELWLSGRPRSTYRNYKNVIDQAERVAMALYGRSVLEVDKFQLQRVAVEITKGVQPNSKGTMYAIIRSFFHALQRLEVRVDDPGIYLKAPRTPVRTAQKIMTFDEVKWLANMGTGRDRLLVQVLYGAGLRAGELCGLKVGDFNPTRRTLFVVGKGSKERTVQIRPELAAGLTEFVHNRPVDEPLFYALRAMAKRPMTPGSVWATIKKLARKAGIRSAISTHWIRHTHATHALENGMDLRDLSRTLGHSSVLVTQKHYDHAITKSSPSDYLPLV